MKCPHCLNAFHPQDKSVDLGDDIDRYWYVKWQKCPSCGKFIISLFGVTGTRGRNNVSYLVYPKAYSRQSLSADVSEVFAKDYKEACAVISDSPNASAALSRRCLQNLLREEAGVKKSDLNKEIDEVLGAKQLPPYLAKSIDAIRNIGNFAAHPIKSTHTGEIVDAEPGEAEWLLDVLEKLFEFYFVQPADLKRKRDALDAKLTVAGKPPMK